MKLKSGVRVEQVDGAAARAGVREGDIVLQVDNTEITGAKQFETVVGKLEKSKAVALLIRRGDGVSLLIVKPSAKPVP